MKTKLLALLIALTSVAKIASAQYWPGDHWYDNPLGFEPVKLHTSMGFLIPAAAVGTCLLLTQKNETLKNGCRFTTRAASRGATNIRTRT